MGFSFNDIFSGGTSGALLGGSIGGPWGALIGAGAGGLLGGLIPGQKKQTQAQQPLETPEQTEARRMLLELAKTGQFGSFRAGKEIPIQYGDYTPTDIESTGLSNFQQLLQTRMPGQFQMGDQALQDILATSPEAIESQFQPFKTQVGREIDEAETGLKRGAAFTGNLYSTDTIKKLGDVRARGTESLTSKLAELTNEALNRKLSAIPLAYQSGIGQENIALNRIMQSQQLGGLTRNLNNAAAQERNAELLRRRGELNLPVQALQSVLNSNVPFGVPSVTTTQPSPFQGVLDLASQIGGQALGNELFLNQYQRFFPQGTGQLPSSSNRMGLPSSLSLMPQYGY